MTDLTTLAKIGLAAIDKQISECPSNRSPLGRRDCPKCGASRKEGCIPVDVAQGMFVEMIRAHLKGTGA